MLLNLGQSKWFEYSIMGELGYRVSNLLLRFFHIDVVVVVIDVPTPPDQLKDLDQ